MTSVQVMHMARGLGFMRRLTFPAGRSVEQIVHAVYGRRCGVTAWVRAPAGYAQDWAEVPRSMWPFVRPKSELRCSYRPGDIVDDAVDFVEDTVDDVVDFVSDVAGDVADFASDVAEGVVDFFTPSFPSGAGGSAADATSRAFANVDSDMNLLRKASYLPVVVGTRRISPPEIAQPFPYIDSGVQSFKRIFAFDGPHLLSDVQVDGTPTAGNTSITTEVLDGKEGTTTISEIVTHVSSVERVSETLSSFSLTGTNLVDQDTPADSEPRWVRFRTVSDEKLVEIVLRLRVDSLLVSTDAEADLRIPIRIRFRPKGSTGDWVNLPEIHITGNSPATVLQEVRIRWDSEFGDQETVDGDIIYQFFQRVPAVTAGTLSDGSTGDQWQAHEHFVLGSGLRAVQNIQGDRNGVRVVLDPTEDDMAQQEFEWEVIRGLATNRTSLTVGTYTISGVVYPFFVSYSTGTTWRVQVAQGNFLGRVSLEYAVAIVDRHPCQRPGTALLALNTRGQSVRNVTVLASRYVSDWDGSGWNTITTTKNPATHYHQILHDWLSYNGVDTDLIVNDDFVAWRAECAARGYEVSAVFSGATTRQVLESIAEAGFARPRFSDGFSIEWFRDRSSERPVQTFSPRNSKISLNWNHALKPTGLRCTFQDEDDGYRDNEIQVSNPFYTTFQGYEVRDATNITSADLVKRRATFELLQAHFQGRRIWNIEAAIEGVICERGDLVGVVTDLLDDANSGARIREVLSDTTLRIDQRIPAEGTTSLFALTDIFDADNIFTVGEQSICLVPTPTGTEQRTIIGAADDVIRVDEPFSSTDLLGAHIAIGPASRFTRRCVVHEVRRKDDETATLTCLDEAPEVWREMEARFG